MKISIINSEAIQSEKLNLLARTVLIDVRGQAPKVKLTPVIECMELKIDLGFKESDNEH